MQTLFAEGDVPVVLPPASFVRTWQMSPATPVP
jgi:hypothetical protein